MLHKVSISRSVKAVLVSILHQNKLIVSRLYTLSYDQYKLNNNINNLIIIIIKWDASNFRARESIADKTMETGHYSMIAYRTSGVEPLLGR